MVNDRSLYIVDRRMLVVVVVVAVVEGENVLHHYTKERFILSSGTVGGIFPRVLCPGEKCPDLALI